MTFYERYETLCAERGLKPQTPEMLAVAGVSSPSVSGWKNGSQPKMDVICRLSKYFGVTSDYLIGLSEVRKQQTIVLSEHEQLLVNAFRSADTAGQQNIIFACQLELKKILPVQVDESDTQLLEGFHRLNENGKKRALDSLNDLVQLPRYTEKLYKIKKAVRGGEFTEEYINEEEKNRLFNGTPINDDML